MRRLYTAHTHTSRIEIVLFYKLLFLNFCFLRKWLIRSGGAWHAFILRFIGMDFFFCRLFDPFAGISLAGSV